MRSHSAADLCHRQLPKSPIGQHACRIFHAQLHQHARESAALRREHPVQRAQREVDEATLAHCVADLGSHGRVIGVPCDVSDPAQVSAAASQVVATFGRVDASISGLRASTLRVAYGTSRAALIHMSKQHAVELGDLGIRVT